MQELPTMTHQYVVASVSLVELQSFINQDCHWGTKGAVRTLLTSEVAMGAKPKGKEYDAVSTTNTRSPNNSNQSGCNSLLTKVKSVNKRGIRVSQRSRRYASPVATLDILE